MLPTNIVDEALKEVAVFSSFLVESLFFEFEFAGNPGEAIFHGKPDLREFLGMLLQLFVMGCECVGEGGGEVIEFVCVDGNLKEICK